MTVREYILDGSLKSAKTRFQMLSSMGAPNVVIESIKNEVSNLEAGKLSISGDLELLEEEFVSREILVGSMGKQYLRINGHINYFPNAKYGRYIKEA